MGYSISWVGVSGIDRVTVLERLGLPDTGEADEGREAPFSAATLGGWTVVWSNDFEHFRKERVLEPLSRGVRVIAACAEEHVMFASAGEWRDGVRLWQVDHDAQASNDHLETAGEPPERFGAIRDAMRAEQIDDAEVDFIFDIPLQLAREITGFKHDENTDFEFTVVGKKKKKGWFG